MKNNFKSRIILPTILSFSILITSCKRDKEDEQTNNPTPDTSGMLEFHIHTMIDTAEVDSGAVAVDAAGRHFQLNDASFYITGVQVQKSDGSWLSLPNAVVMVSMEEEEYQIANIPAGNYTTVAFDLGLDATRNATNPLQYAEGDPLANTDMYFGAALGYKFLNLTGLADTSATQSGNVDSPISYQLGTAAELVHVQLPDQPFTMLAGDHAFIHMAADYGALLEGADFKTQGIADPSTNLAVTQQIAANVHQFIHYEE